MTARTAAFIPCASPPEVRIATPAHGIMATEVEGVTTKLPNKVYYYNTGVTKKVTKQNIILLNRSYNKMQTRSIQSDTLKVALQI